MEGYPVCISALLDPRGVEDRQRPDLLSDDFPVEAAGDVLQVRTYASDEMRAAVLRARREILQKFQTRRSERRRARSHLARLRVLSSGRGVILLSNLSGRFHHGVN